MYGHAPTFPSLVMRLYPSQTCYKDIKPCACSIRSCYMYASFRQTHSLARKIMSYITGMTGIRIISLICHIGVSQGEQPSKNKFDVYGAVHRQCILSSIPTRRNVMQYSLLLSMLYMFQAAFPPIIRSSKTVHTAYGIHQACLLLPLAW